MGMPVKMPRA
jgi:DNA-binding winged helix-turn-helix (wHTH) protein